MRGENNEDRVLSLLEWLKENTDESKKIGNVNELKKRMINEEGIEVTGDYKTIQKRINNIVNFFELNKDNKFNFSIKGNSIIENENIILKDIYFESAFSRNEIAAIIEGVKTSNISDKEADELVEKILKYICNKHNRKDLEKYKHIYSKPKLSVIGNKEKEIDIIKNNEKVIDIIKNKEKVLEAIKKRRGIEFDFIGHSENKEIYTRSHFNNMSVYKLYKEKDRYYLQMSNNDNKKAYLVRLDYINNIDFVESGGFKESPRAYTVDNNANNNFINTHIGMSYDDPVTVILRIGKLKRKDEQIDISLIYDEFGENFDVVRVVELEKEEKEEKEKYVDVEVKASKFGIINWAISYGDRVEIIEPKEVVKEIKEKIKRLNEKYSNNKFERGELK